MYMYDAPYKIGTLGHCPTGTKILAHVFVQLGSQEKMAVKKAKNSKPQWLKCRLCHMANELLISQLLKSKK